MSKFVYFGTPYVARDTLACLVEHGFVPEVVVTSPAAPKGRGLTLTPSETNVWATEHGISVLTPTVLDQSFIDQLSAHQCDYAIVVAYGKIIPQALIDAFPKGILNIHYSLLPKYRGASPVEASLLHGETVTGVTIQQMVFELDAGDVIAQEEVTIDPNDTTLSLRPKLIEAGADLLVRTLPAFIEGSVTPVTQDALLATRAKKIKKEEGCLSLYGDGAINWNTYRAFRESPGTYFFAHKGDTKIRVKIVDAKCESGAFQVTRIVPEGKNEQPFSYLADNGWTPE
ncbi:MAG: methionyl-tRNA formyltransferase [Parcubacteria group bacterium]|nr:methionyl-tRNA formyltransferase [Parcubacteria group bacterium]